MLVETLLVRRSQQGDMRAFEALYRHNSGRIYALCLRLCGQREWAEDLPEETKLIAQSTSGNFKVRD